MFEFDFVICPCIISVFLILNSVESDLSSLFRTWVLMSCQSVCRTFTRTSQTASRPSSKVLLNTYVQEESAINCEYHQCYTVYNVSTVNVFVLLLLGSSDHVESVMDEVEKYMMTRLYKEVFCPETTDDEKKDLAIQKRIRLAKQSCNAQICYYGSHSCLCISFEHKETQL